jgi:hypothetical protein
MGGGQKRMSKEMNLQSSLLSPITVDSTVDSDGEVIVEARKMGKCHSPKC